jgi:hypothetical protein
MCSHGLVGYDTALTRLGPRVQFPLAVLTFYSLRFLLIKGVLGFWGFGVLGFRV